MSKYSLGIDVGSTTVKTVITDADGNIIYSKYQRHFSKVWTGTQQQPLKKRIWRSQICRTMQIKWAQALKAYKRHIKDSQSKTTQCWTT